MFFIYNRPLHTAGYYLKAIVARDTADDFFERLEIVSPVFSASNQRFFSRVTLGPRFGVNIALTLDEWSAMFKKG